MYIGLQFKGSTPQGLPGGPRKNPTLDQVAVKRKQLLCIEGASPRHGLGTPKVKSLVCDADPSQTLMV